MNNAEARLRGAAGILAALEENGEDLQQPRPVELFFFGDKSGLEAVYKELEAEGYQLRWISEPQLGITAQSVAVTNADWVISTTHKMVTLGDKHAVIYDGWEAGMAAQVGKLDQ